MTIHLVRGSGLITLLVLCTFYPFFSGMYDALATPLSAMAQVLGVVGLLFVPVGVLWLIYELRKRARAKSNLSTKARGYYFALASMVVFSLIAIAVSFGAFLGLGLSFGFVTLALWFYVASRLRPGLKSLKSAEVEGFNYVPLYLVFVPCMVLIFQWRLLLARLTSAEIVRSLRAQN